MKIIKYVDQYKDRWNEFVKNAKNSHFFFQREYMEYHSDRFQDFSLIVLDEKKKLYLCYLQILMGIFCILIKV